MSSPLGTSAGIAVAEAPAVQPFRKITRPERAHIPALDGVRGFAAISVFLFHYGELGRSASHALRFINVVKLRGAYGVDIFFALSGFLITGILWDMRHAGRRWLNFYRNRALRLFPLYYSLWGFLALYCIAFHHPWYRSNLAYIFYAGNFVFPFKDLNQIGPFNISHLWSLACEEQFYMVWPLLVWRIGRIETLKRIALIAFFASLSLKLIALGIHMNPRWSYALLPFRLEGLCAGAYCALALRTHPKETIRIGRRIFWILAPVTLGFFTIAALRPLSAPVEHLFAFGLIGTVSATLIAMAVDPASWSSRIFSNSILRVAGKYSYGIYVYSIFLHDVFKRYVLLHVVHVVPGRVGSGVVYLFVVICLTMLICVASYQFLERPFLKLKWHKSPARS